MSGPATRRAIPVAVASNRGPVTFARADDGGIEARGGVGGLVRVLETALRRREASWVAMTLTDEDREMASRGRVTAGLDGGSVPVRLVPVSPDELRSYYGDFSNRILWFLHHYVWDLASAPLFGEAEDEAWETYRAVNARVAAALAEETPGGGTALVQDYHLSLVAPALRAARPDVRAAYFWHISFCQPDQYRALPDAWGVPLLEGMLAADLVGFQSPRWMGNFLACCREVLGARVTGRAVRHDGRVTRVGVYPVGVETAHLRRQAEGEAVAREADALDALIGDRLLVLRADRTEPTKNIVRGLAAFDRLLARRPDLHGRVVHLARLTPSRIDIPEYRAYLERCRARAAEINTRFGTGDWTPVHLDVEDNFARTLAAYRRYDVLLANSTYDGMNLIAREGPILNHRDGALVLSRNAGAAVELAPAAILVNPFDVEQTARALAEAIDLPAAERARRGAELRRLAPGLPPDRWLDAQLRDAARER